MPDYAFFLLQKINFFWVNNYWYWKARIARYPLPHNLKPVRMSFYLLEFVLIIFFLVTRLLQILQ